MGRSGRMAATAEDEAVATSTIVAELRGAVRALRMRGLKHATRFASELLLGIPEDARRQHLHGGNGLDDDDEDGEEDLDRYDAARATFEMGEYLRAHQLLASAPRGGRRTLFLQLYALFLAGEKTKEEQELELSVPGTAAAGASGAVGAGGSAAVGTKSDVEPLVDRQGANPHLKELYLALRDQHQRQRLDGFGLYLFAVVLRRLGYDTADGMQLATGNASGNFSTSTATTSTRAILVASIRAFPWNWSAWMELAALSPFTSPEEEIELARASPWMFHLFQAHVLLDQQQTDPARRILDQLALVFPQSTYLVAQQALTSYHLRDFDHAQEQFERLAIADPYRIDTMDVYSNVLYVKEDKTELSRLAHRALQVEKYRPETCCIIGNYYSLKNKHDRAIVYFNRALKLDPNFLSAWTLIGHEYVEMKNTSAAIEAYRRAVDLNARDYRAWYGLGQAYEILNMYLYSIYYYKKAATIRPYDARMWCALGGCFEKLQKAEDAIACFERAVGNNDREGIASFHLGRIHAQRGEQHEAAKYYELHLGLGESSIDHPSSAPMIRLDTPQALAAVLFLANYYKQLGQYARAVVFCNRLLDLQGPEKEEAKALLREIRSLEASTRPRPAGHQQRQH